MAGVASDNMVFPRAISRSCSIAVNFAIYSLNMIKKAALLLLLAIVINAILLAFTWAHHTFVTGLNPFLGTIFLVLSLLILVAVVFFSFRWVARQSLRLTPAMAFIFGLFVFLIGDLMNTVNNGNSTIDIQLHDSYFVIAHVHLILFFALLFLAFAAVYFVFPKITGRTMNAPMGYIHFALTLIAAYFLCWPYHYTGLAGMPRRYMDYSNWVARMDEFTAKNNFTTWTMILLVCGQVVFLANLVWSAVKGEKWRPI
jgi:cytochrome c oxidase subunit 1